MSRFGDMIPAELRAKYTPEVCVKATHGIGFGWTCPSCSRPYTREDWPHYRCTCGRYLPSRCVGEDEGGVRCEAQIEPIEDEDFHGRTVWYRPPALCGPCGLELHRREAKPPPASSEYVELRNVTLKGISPHAARIRFATGVEKWVPLSIIGEDSPIGAASDVGEKGSILLPRWKLPDLGFEATA